MLNELYYNIRDELFELYPNKYKNVYRPPNILNGTKSFVSYYSMI